jgi:DNA-binding NarL/FixJ family response regulator
MQIKLVLAEDSAAVRGAVVDVLKGYSRIEVVGQTETLAQTLEVVAALRPDVLILDLHMPDDGEFLPEFLKMELQKTVPCILAMSMSVDDEAKQRAEAVGAKVLMDKMNLYTELVSSIKRFVR